MDSDRHEDSGEMYFPDERGEYMPLDGAPRFSMQGLSNALADVREGITEPPAEEYAMLEVMMADCPGQLHILKNDPVLRELEHMQVDGPGTAYLFFCDRQGRRGLGQDTAYAIWTHVEEAFLEWITCSTHFTISLLPLVEAWQQAVATSDCRRLRGQAENPAPRIPILTVGDSSMQLVDSTPQQAGRSTTVEETADARPATHVGTVRQWG